MAGSLVKTEEETEGMEVEAELYPPSALTLANLAFEKMIKRGVECLIAQFVGEIQGLFCHLEQSIAQLRSVSGISQIEL